MIKKKDFLLTLIPFIFIIHNVEEVLFFSLLKKQLSGLITYSITYHQFLFATLLLSITGIVATFISIKKNKLVVLNGFISIMFFNTITTHLFLFIYYKTYTPGIISSCFLILPVSIYLIKKFNYELNKKEFWSSLILGPFIGLILTWFFLFISYIFKVF